MKIAALLIVALGGLTGDWMVSLALGALGLGYLLLRVHGGVPVLFAAYAFQWMQVCSGFFYTLLTGRVLEASYASDYRTMMYLGLASILALAAGIRLGYDFLAQRAPEHPIDRPIVSDWWLWLLYGGSLATTATVQALAWEFPLLTQPILALTFARLAILYLLLRRLVAPEFQFVPLAAVVALEIVLGMTSYFAGFREPLVLATLAVLEVFDRRRVGHWATAGVLVATASFMGLLWLGVRVEYRRDFADIEMFAESQDMRLARLQELAQGWWKQDSHEFWWNLDLLMDRLWTVYYPALAVARVPSALPHTDGALMSAALAHVFMPRVLFPEKPPLPSDSEMVRQYSGVWVAGADQNTSIAFGYVAESYLDFGIPLMFVPMIIWGAFVGVSYRTLQVMIRHREVAVPVLTVVFWLCVYLFERSWAKTMGLTGTMLIYVGGVAFIVDQWLIHTAKRRMQLVEDHDIASDFDLDVHQSEFEAQS
jgi:hypothetical protein